jgi:hypothetical protein
MRLKWKTKRKEHQSRTRKAVARLPQILPNPKFHNTLTLPLKTPSASRKLLVPGLARAHPLRYFSATNDKRYITALNTIPIETPK